MYNFIYLNINRIFKSIYQGTIMTIKHLEIEKPHEVTQDSLVIGYAKTPDGKSQYTFTVTTQTGNGSATFLPINTKHLIGLSRRQMISHAEKVVSQHGLSIIYHDRNGL